MKIIHLYNAIQVQRTLAVLKSMNFGTELSNENEMPFEYKTVFPPSTTTKTKQKECSLCTKHCSKCKEMKI